VLALASRDCALQVKAAVLSDALTLLGFKAHGAAACGRATSAPPAMDHVLGCGADAAAQVLLQGGGLGVLRRRFAAQQEGRIRAADVRCVTWARSCI
jgi:hypothetical protein